MMRVTESFVSPEIAKKFGEGENFTPDSIAERNKIQYSLVVHGGFTPGR